MSDDVIELRARKEGREREVEAQDMLLDDLLMWYAMLAQTIQHMKDFSEDEKVLSTLRFAVSVFVAGGCQKLNFNRELRETC